MCCVMERVWKPNVDTSPNCPRCGCSNTKFCYYNNYSLTQPRYFCKGCRRYWTKGGSLRNVPVGGGCRKARRGSHKTGVHARSAFGCGSTSASVPNNGPIVNGHCVYGHVNGGNSANNLLAHDGSHIDLALVYANFLSQKPDLSKAGNNAMSSAIIGSEINIHELGSENFDPCLEFQNPTQHDHIMTDLGSSIIDQNHEQIFFCRGQENCASDFGILPPLPGQEAILWSSSPNQMMISQASQELPVVGPEVDHHHHQEEINLLNGNCWSPFDLPSDHDTFSESHEKI